MALLFKNYDLLVDGKRPNIEMYKNILNGIPQYHSSKNYTYNFTHEMNEDENYYWMSVLFENHKAYNKEVMDEKTHIITKNPKSKNQLEFRHQFFGLYDFNTSILYLSNADKKSIVVEYLHNACQQEVCIKNIYKSIDEFVGHIREVSEISFIDRDNFFKEKKDIYDSANDNFGLDYPDSLYIKASYKSALIEKTGSDWIKQIFEKHRSGKIENLVISGYGDEKFEQTFDSQNYVKTISINVAADDNNLYDTKGVLKKVLQKLRS